MKCLRCSREIPADFFSHLSRSVQFKGGRFACPHCGAEHVRRPVGELPSGEPLYSFRLWGHLAAAGSNSAPVAGKGADRRQAQRGRSRR